MTIELVDGHGGKPHISGEDLGDFKAGILGDAGYVFKRANMLAATLNGSNSITIATGSGIMPASGRHFRVTAPETLTITSGTQGQNRNDLIVVRATTDEESTTVETATLVVLRGTPTSGTATDPATQDGDFPLYRLQLTGVSVAEPIALFDVMVPYSEFRDSISQELEKEVYSGSQIMSAASGTNSGINVEHNSNNSIVKIYGSITTGTNVLSRVLIPGCFSDSGQQMYGAKTNIHIDVSKAYIFGYIGLYSRSINGDNKVGFLSDSTGLAIGTDGYMYISPSNNTSSISGDTNRWLLLNIPLLLN